MLAQRQREPGNINLFSSSSGNFGPYAVGGTPMTPDDGSVPDDTQVREELVQFLQTQLDDDEKINESLALFESSQLKAMIESPTIRAAFVSLPTTLAADNLDFFINSGRFVTIGYETPTFPNAIAQSLFAVGTNGKQRILINPRYDREHFPLLIPVIAHEILHHDNVNNNNEEVVASAITGMIWMQLILRQPELAYGGTELTRLLNTFSLASINSRHPGSPHLSLLAEDGEGLFPGGRAINDYFTWLGGYAALTPSPAPDPLRNIMTAVLAAETAIPEPLVYDIDLIRVFDNMNGENWMSPVDRLRLSVLLQLVSVDEIVQHAGISAAQAIHLLDLDTVLTAIESS